MNAASFEETLEEIVRKDPRYGRDVYLFVREALDFTQKVVTKSGKVEARERAEKAEKSEREREEVQVRHVSGQELLAGIRAFALEQYGPMALTLLREWGVHSCADFGEIVFNMVENNLLAKTQNDTRDDFKNGYDFAEAFRKPFIPSRRPGRARSQPKPSKA